MDQHGEQVLIDSVISIADAVKTLAWHIEQSRKTGDELPAIEQEMRERIERLRTL